MGHEIDDELRRIVKVEVRNGRKGCEDCDNTGWRAKIINPFMSGWELCPCWIGDRWEQIAKRHAALENGGSSWKIQATRSNRGERHGHDQGHAGDADA